MNQRPWTFQCSNPLAESYRKSGRGALNCGAPPKSGAIARFCRSIFSAPMGVAQSSVFLMISLAPPKSNCELTSLFLVYARIGIAIARGPAQYVLRRNARQRAIRGTPSQTARLAKRAGLNFSTLIAYH
jgi:hypothetical protein